MDPPLLPADARARVLEFTARPFAPIATVEDADGRGARLIEPASGKELRVRWDELSLVEERRSDLRSAPYLLLAFADGRQVALADVGFAFAPDPRNTGQLPDLPPVLCFRDFRHLSDGIQALLAEDGREREALSAVLICIALLDGARALGLDVSREEHRLDGLLRALESRGLRI